MCSPRREYTFKDNLGRPVGMDGCNRAAVHAEYEVTPDGQAGSTPTGLTVDEHVPQETSLNPDGPGGVRREGPVGDAARRRGAESRRRRTGC